MKVYGDTVSIAPHILNLGSKWRWKGGLTPQFLHPWKRPPCTHWTGGQVWCGASGEEARFCLENENSVLLGEDTVSLRNRTLDISRQYCLQTSGSDYPVKQYHNPKQLNPQLHRCENLETRNKLNYWKRITNVKNDVHQLTHSIR